MASPVSNNNNIGHLLIITTTFLAFLNHPLPRSAMSLRTLLPFQPIDIVPPHIPLNEYNNRLNPLSTHNLYRVPREDDPRNALPPKQPEPAATKSSGLSAAIPPALSCIFDKKTSITYTCRRFLGEVRAEISSGLKNTVQACAKQFVLVHFLSSDRADSRDATRWSILKAIGLPQKQ